VAVEHDLCPHVGENSSALPRILLDTLRLSRITSRRIIASQGDGFAGLHFALETTDAQASPYAKAGYSNA
jgi:hypothetical protein